MRQEAARFDRQQAGSYKSGITEPAQQEIVAVITGIRSVEAGSLMALGGTNLIAQVLRCR